MFRCEKSLKWKFIIYFVILSTLTHKKQNVWPTQRFYEYIIAIFKRYTIKITYAYRFLLHFKRKTRDGYLIVIF